MAKPSRYTFSFASDGASLTYGAGDILHTLMFDKLSASVLREMRNNGAKQALSDTCANATKLGWSDAQCADQMHRRVVAWVNGSWTTDNLQADFPDLVTVAMAVYGRDRVETESALMRRDNEWRNAFRVAHAVAIAEAKVERLRTTLPTGGAAPSAKLDDLFA